MKEAYSPLPTLPSPRFKELVPGITRLVNWIPAARPIGSLPSEIPQNIEEFDNWAWVVHTPENYTNLHQVCKYVHYINEIPSAAISPLMHCILAHWRLPS
jgi:hypothetical protein